MATPPVTARVDVVHWALAVDDPVLTRVTAVHPEMDVPPCVNPTVPVGVPAPLVRVTVAVNVTGDPYVLVEEDELLHACGGCELRRLVERAVPPSATQLVLDGGILGFTDQ